MDQASTKMSGEVLDENDHEVDFVYPSLRTPVFLYPSLRTLLRYDLFDLSSLDHVQTIHQIVPHSVVSCGII